MAITPGDLARVRQEKLARDAMTVDERNAELTDAVSHAFAAQGLTWGDSVSPEMFRSGVPSSAHGSAAGDRLASAHGAATAGHRHADTDPDSGDEGNDNTSTLLDDAELAARITQEADALETAHELLHQALEN